MLDSPKPNSGEFLSKYTELPFLIHLLKTGKLTMLSPTYWDDKNDTNFIAAYAQIKNIKSVLTYCLTAESETYHHWKVFCPGMSGVRIEFDKYKFINWVEKNADIKSGYVKYRTIQDLSQNKPAVDDLPFIKRHPYRHESEFRVIFESKLEAINTKDLKFDISLIKRVVVSPWVPKEVYKSIKSTINLIPKCQNILVHRTTLVDNEQWQNVAKLASALS